MNKILILAVFVFAVIASSCRSTDMRNDKTNKYDIPNWALKIVSAEQIASAKKRGIPVAIEVKLNKRESIRMVFIPPGVLLRERNQSGEQSLQRDVCFPNGFYISITETTQAQWLCIMDNNPSSIVGGEEGCPKDTSQYPVEAVSWDEVKEFILKLNHKFDTISFRLPGESEWEYASKAGSKSDCFNNKKHISSYVWYRDNSKEITHKVAQKDSNPWGLYDVYGNVEEWCEDDYHANYLNVPVDGTPWVETPRTDYRVVRGGSFLDNLTSCNSAKRKRVQANGWNFLSVTGFRIVKDISIDVPHEK